MANFKPGDKVWVTIFNDPYGVIGPGKHQGIICSERCGLSHCWLSVPGYWVVDVEGCREPDLHCHENTLTPRDDPPPQQEPKREEVGSWETCKWSPDRDWRPDPPNIVRITVTVPGRPVEEVP